MLNYIIGYLRNNFIENISCISGLKRTENMKYKNNYNYKFNDVAMQKKFEFEFRIKPFNS